MSITNTGGQDFGTSPVGGFIAESVSITNPAETVELKDGNGLSLGMVTVPGRATMSATVQSGASGTAPAIGSDITIDTVVYVITEVSINESQGDYKRFTLSGLAKEADTGAQTV